MEVDKLIVRFTGINISHGNVISAAERLSIYALAMLISVKNTTLVFLIVVLIVIILKIVVELIAH